MKFIRSLLLLFLLKVVLHAPPAFAATEWLTDLAKAQAKSQSGGKFVLIHLSGSYWCGWCMKLRKDVFVKPEFESYAKSNLVLVRIDFPRRTKQSTELAMNNRMLAQQFQVQGYPTLVLLDSIGSRLGTVSYGHGGAKQFISDVEKVIRPRPDLVPKVPASRSLDTRRAGNSSVRSPVATAELTLRRITGSKQRRQALINDRTLSVGETATVKVRTGRVKVRCLEIREKSAVVSVDGERGQRELTLGAGT
jgi:protein disulfide-isomerase